jgi:hypothetical protein
MLNEEIKNKIIRDKYRSRISIKRLAQRYNVSYGEISKLLKIRNPVYFNYIR